MKSLQQYLLENLDTIEEGKIWDAIKNWFKELFEPSDRPYDRYNEDNDISGANRENYISYLKDNFSIKNCEVKKVDKDDLKKIIYPNNHQPDLENKLGFYKFIDTKNGNFYSIVYKDDQVKDTPVLIKVKEGEILEILDLQIISEFSNIFMLKDVIDLLVKSDDIKNIKKIIFKENSDKDIYKQLINDCSFKEEFNDTENQNIAILEL